MLYSCSKTFLNVIISVFTSLFVSLFALGLSSCENVEQNSDPNSNPNSSKSLSSSDKAPTSLELKHAVHFSVSYFKDYTLLEVQGRSGTRSAESHRFSYALLDHDSAIPKECKSLNIIRVPIRDVVCVSTTHAALFSALNQQEKVVGLSWGENIYDSKLKSAYTLGKIREISRQQDLDMEVILDIGADAVLTYITEDPSYGDYAKMNALGIPVIVDAEFEELSPLGQAEWIKLAGVLLKQEAKADSVFSYIEARYLHLRDSAASLQNYPLVFTGMDWKGAWTVPGGLSFAAQYIADANGKYIWSEDNGKGSIPLDFETVFVKAASADVWLNPGASRSLHGIEQADKRLAHFKAWKEGKVYNNDNRLSQSGGNDYWESAVVRPDLVLKDLIEIFHSKSGKPNSMYYYRQLPGE